MNLAGELRYDPSGLLPVVLQDADSLEVLILAFMDRTAVERTLSSGLVHLWSRSRGGPWLKGESSGRLQHVVEVRPNCELSSLLLLVHQALPGACHTGHSGCFYRRLKDGELVEVSPPLFDPGDVYGGEGKRPLEELLGAYGWIAGQELIPESGTSKVLHARGPDPLERLRQEWDELLGVLDGTHVHSGFEEDVLLEAYQVLYWTCLHHVLSGLGDAALAVESLAEGYGGDRPPAVLLREAMDADGPAPRLRRLWSALGAACREAGLEPSTVVRKDLQELRGRAYMSRYFGTSR